MSDPKIERKTFDFLSILTAVTVLIHLGTASAAFLMGKMELHVYLGVVGTPSGMLLGYWVRGAK